MTYFTHGRREVLELLRAVPMTMREVADIMGRHREHINRVLLALEDDGYAIRYGRLQGKRGTAAVWHWTGKNFGKPITTERIAAMQTRCLQLDNQTQRYALSVEIALRLDGLSSRSAA